MKPISFLTAIILLISCKSKYPDYTKVDFKEIELGCCLKFDSSYIINGDMEYRTRLNDLNVDLPDIDFSRYTLIGKLYTGQCNEDCYKIKDVFIKEESETILIDIKKKSNPLKCGCKKKITTMKWLLIPKTSVDYKSISYITK